jgi:hypothetical protein
MAGRRIKLQLFILNLVLLENKKKCEMMILDRICFIENFSGDLFLKDISF